MKPRRGDQRIVAEGIVPPAVVSSAEYFEPSLRGLTPPGNVWIGVAGLDLVRDSSGEWLVLGAGNGLKVSWREEGIGLYTENNAVVTVSAAESSITESSCEK